MDKLAEIMAAKQREIAEYVRPVSERELSALATATVGGSRFGAVLSRDDRLSVIAEIKRRSPSAGAIAESINAVEQAKVYAAAGADCFSILTDGPYFGGTMADLREVTDFLLEGKLEIPCLRKDFMLHPIQVVEAAKAGASAILIIVRALSDETIKELFAAATLAGLDALFEIHEEPELERAVRLDAKIIGVNNRDLKRFQTDMAISEKLIPQIPSSCVKISESGIFTPEDAARARACGADAILVGEALMRAEDTQSLMRAFHQA